MKCPNCGKSLLVVRSFCRFCKTSITAPPRPKAVAVAGWLFLLLGSLVLLYSLLASPSEARSRMVEFRSQHPLRYALSYIGPAVAAVGGLFTLLGHNWARWLLVGFMAFSTVANALHSPLIPVLFCLLMFVVTGYYLFRPRATAFFRGQVLPNPGPNDKSSG